MEKSKKQNTLSKSAFIRSLQCLKSLFLYKNFYKLRDMPSKELLERFRQGTAIGRLAWQLFPNGVDLSPGSAFPSAIAKAAVKTSQQLLSEGVVIYEASFIHQPILTILDILVKENGKLFAYEVKSSVEISETYIRDIAFQYFVMNKAGYRPEKFSIVHLKEGYDSTSNSTDCFRITDVTNEILNLQDFIKENIDCAIKAMKDDSLLGIQQGEHCHNPYLCDFLGYCSKQ